MGLTEGKLSIGVRLVGESDEAKALGAENLVSLEFIDLPAAFVKPGGS
jgi:hypothetical protein